MPGVCAHATERTISSALRMSKPEGPLRASALLLVLLVRRRGTTPTSLRCSVFATVPAVSVGRYTYPLAHVLVHANQSCLRQESFQSKPRSFNQRSCRRKIAVARASRQ